MNVQCISEETLDESETKQTPCTIGTYFGRLACRPGHSEPVPIDSEQPVTVSLAAEPELEDERQHLSLEIELEWDANRDELETDGVASKTRLEVDEDAVE